MPTQSTELLRENEKKLEKSFEQVTIEKQNNFLDGMLGKTINAGLDIGIRMLLPDFIENQVIEVKDELLENGVKAGIDKAIQSVMDLGKSAAGIVTGKFDNISQVQTAVEKGGILDSISGAIDFALKVINKKEILPNNVTSMIRSGKNIVLDNISNSIEKTLTNQIRSVEKIDRYTSNWQGYYQEKDIEGMQREYDKIREEIKNVIPIENTIKKAREVQNLHRLIKNKGEDFSLSQEEIELAKKLI